MATLNQSAKDVLARLRAKIEAAPKEQPGNCEHSEPTSIESTATTTKQEEAKQEATQKESEAPKKLEWNAAQKEFISLGADLTSLSNRRMILTGAAGTGKTTAVKGLVETFLVMSRMGGFPTLQEGTKYLVSGAAGIAAVAFTNKAVENVRKVMPKELKPHCLTIHKLLEFGPVFYEVWDEERNEMRRTMRFEPARNKHHKLPTSLKVVLIDEASMVATAERGDDDSAQALFEQLEDALAPGTKIIFIGDIQQLPPVFGDSILGHSLLKVPTVELTEVYRQALESPIIRMAWHILKGEAGFFNSRTEKDPNNAKRIVVPSFERFNNAANGAVKIIPWQKKFNAHQATIAASNFLFNLATSGGYLPDEDILLCPFNVSFGQEEINKHLANNFGRLRQAVVHEVIVGVNKKYLAVGDKVIYQKEEFKIMEINHNAAYLGKTPGPASVNLDRWGTYQTATSEASEEETYNSVATLDDIDAMLEAAAGATDSERFNHASHIITIANRADPSIEFSLGTTGELANLELGYCITVHKSQGSEWRRVFCLFHHTHAVMLFRELLYTAVTRAREELVIICEPNSLEKAILNPRIKGTTLEDKAAFFAARKETKQKLKSLELDLDN